MGIRSFLFQADQPRTSILWTELEALALVETVRHFGYYLYGKEFVAYTDHKPLCALLLFDRLNGRLRRLGMTLQHWLITIQYLPGEDNGMVDALARVEILHKTAVYDGRQSGSGGCGGETSACGKPS